MEIKMGTKGYKSTEFYLALAAVVIGALMASGVFPADSLWCKLMGVAAACLAALGYTGARLMLKKEKLKADAIVASATASVPGATPPNP